MGFMVSGQVRELEDRQGIAGVVVQALDKDFLCDDLLGNTTTDANGSFCIKYTEESSKDLLESSLL